MSELLSKGELIGERYDIQRKIGEGGMQFVYEAYDILTERLVALKTPKNKSATKRFKRSAIVAAKVNHPNVAKTLDYLKVDGQRFLIEELIQGDDLADALLRETKFIDPYLAAKVFHHLAKGVAAAHHAGVIHRDLKPSNVMVAGGYSLEELKITDFGIAKLAGDELEEAAAGGSVTLTMSQTAVGALPYMAPEAIDTPKEVTVAADIWSLGAMMYHLICGEAPYGTGLRAVRSILAAERPAVPKFLTANPQFAPLASEVMNIALTCLMRDPLDRPTADELVAKCSQLCYTSSPRRRGVVRRIDYGKYGFISTETGDVFFHMECVYGTTNLNEGDAVLFSSYDGGGAPRALPVIKLQS
jgi:serine/threonine protein kinase